MKYANRNSTNLRRPPRRSHARKITARRMELVRLIAANPTWTFRQYAIELGVSYARSWQLAQILVRDGWLIAEKASGRTTRYRVNVAKTPVCPCCGQRTDEPETWSPPSCGKETTR
jgi:hypothetical protein